jgi:hypothetical protein
MKICKICNIEQPLINFYDKKVEKDGKHRYCSSCMKKEKKLYYSRTKESRADYYKTYREENKEYFNNYCSNHYHTNKELYREWNNNKYATDLGFKIKHIVVGRIHSALKTYQLLKTDKTIEYLGCSIGDYCNYLESKFDKNMNWENQGDYWEIDHIKPISSFNLDNEEDLYKVFHYTKTQPLEKKENRLKSNNT